MLRDSDSKGKKLLFDSLTTARDILTTNDFHDSGYDQITDGFGYKVGGLSIVFSLSNAQICSIRDHCLLGHAFNTLYPHF